MRDLPTRPITHVGYVVEELEPAVEWAVRTLGAGPFFVVDRVPFDTCTFRGEAASYVHSSAFGQWGPIKVELTVVHSAEPAALRDLMRGAPPTVGHVGWLADDLEAETAALAAAGMPLFHTGSSGPVAAHWHDGRAVLGHHVEVLRRSPELEGFYERIRAAAEGWDGSDPVRPGPGGRPS